MSDTRIAKSAKGLLLLFFLAAPLFVSVLPELSWNNPLFLTSGKQNQTPKSAAIPTLGFGRFWVNGTELRENNTLYAHVGDVLRIELEAGTGIPAGVNSIPVTFQQIVGGTSSFSGGTLSNSGSLVSGDVTIGAGITSVGLYRVTLIAGKGFNFHVNISHAPPVITSIMLWDTAYKPDQETVLDQGTYESYRNTNIYANITYKIRSTDLFGDIPVITMRYEDGTGTPTEVSVPTSSWPGLGTYTCAAPVIVTTPNTSNKWRPGVYPLNFTISYTGALDTYAAINLQILNIPPNITSMSINPKGIPMPTVYEHNASVRFQVEDPDDDLLYGTSDRPITMTRDGDIAELGTGVSADPYDSPNKDMKLDDNLYTSFNFNASAYNRNVTFEVSLLNTNITTATNAQVGLKVSKNSSTCNIATLEIYNNVTRVWTTLFDFTSLPNATWGYNQTTITPSTHMNVNNTGGLFVRVRAYNATADLAINIDWLNVTYNTTRRPGITGVFVTAFSPYDRASYTTNGTITYDVTECYDATSRQWMFNLSFIPGVDKGPYSIRFDVYDHGTAPYRPFSEAFNRSAVGTYIGSTYTAGRATLSRGIMVGDVTASNVTIVAGAPRWGGSPTGMTVNRGDSVFLAVQIDDDAFKDSLTESTSAFPFNSNVTGTGWTSEHNFPTMKNGFGVTSVNASAAENNTYLPAEGAHWNVSLGGAASHDWGLNNFHIMFSLEKYYFVPNEYIDTLTLDIRACINAKGMPTNTIDYTRVQVYNGTDQKWYNVTSDLAQYAYFGKFDSFSAPFSQTFGFSEIRQCIDPQTREIWFRLQYNESDPTVAAAYGLNISIDYLRLTVGYHYTKTAIAMLSQDLYTFYWFPMSTTAAGTITTWTVTIPTSALPKGTYALTIRTQTLFNGVNYNFTGRFTNAGPIHTTQDWQGLAFKNCTLKVKPAGVSVTLNPAWVNKTVTRGKSAALNLQGSYAISSGSTSDSQFRLQLKQGGFEKVYNVYKGNNELASDIAYFDYASTLWWTNISFAQGAVWAPGVYYFRIWLQANDESEIATDWQEFYLIPAPPLINLHHTYPAILDIWRETDYENFVPMNVTDYDSDFLSACSAQVILEAENRTGGLHAQNVSIWTKSGLQAGASPTFILSGVLNVDKDVANKTFDNFTLVAIDNDPAWIQTSVMRQSATFNIFNNFPQVTNVVYNTTEPFRYHDVNVTIEYEDIDDPLWSDVTVKNFSLKTVIGDIFALQKQNADFIWTGSGTTRNATFRFARDAILGDYNVNLTLQDPDLAETVDMTIIKAKNNLPVVFSLDMKKNAEANVSLGDSSGIHVIRTTDALGFNVTLRDEEDSYLGSLHVSQVSIRLRHEAPAAAVTKYAEKLIPLTRLPTVGGVETWITSAPFTLDKTDLTFGAGTINVSVVAQDSDAGINDAYQAGGAYPDIIVDNTAPSFFAPNPVHVPISISYLGYWNVTVACYDWEGIHQIDVGYKGYKEDGTEARTGIVSVTASGAGNRFVINGTDWYECNINLSAIITQYQIKTLNVTRITLYDADYLVVYEDTTYGLAWTTVVIKDRQTTVGDLPVTVVDWRIIIFIVVGIVAAVVAIYAVVYFRKKLSYRRYM